MRDAEIKTLFNYDSINEGSEREDHDDESECVASCGLDTEKSADTGNKNENSESGGTYKNYSFSFSKRFLNDKLTVIIGGEVNSGDTPANANDNSFINNVSLEWKISESGNRYLRIFYDKNYESILEGEITETGVGYIYKRNMSSLKELFTFKRRNKDKKEDSKNVK